MFFNKKEQVIEFQLTQHGKQLLSQGEFGPVYYDFIDDDVIYDSDKAGLSEEQNDAEDRIFNAIRPMTQYSYTSAQDRVSKAHLKKPGETWITHVTDEDKEWMVSEQDEKDIFLCSPLGNSAVGNQYAPSWNISVQSGKVSGSIESYSSSSYTSAIKVPQVNVEPIQFVPSVVQESLPFNPESAVQNDSLYFIGSRQVYESSRTQEGKYIQIEGDSLVVSISEDNAPVDKEPFEIELFLIDYITVDGVTKEVMKPLMFAKECNLVDENGFLKDKVEEEESAEILNNNAEHYFDVYVDSEINSTYVSKRSGNLYTSKVTEEDGPFGKKC
jgi:hypothetical protein